MEYVFGFLVLIVIGLLVTLLMRGKNGQDDQQMVMLSNRMDGVFRDLTSALADVRKEMQASLTQTHSQLNIRLDNAAKVIGGVENKLGKLEESSKQIYEIGKDISSLQNILRAPKLRGGLGELFLGDLLSQVLPREHYALQHRFKTNEAVDAVVILKDDMLVCIDSKFPLENFLKMSSAEGDDKKKALRKTFVSDVKKHVDAIATKYILPDEHTLDFALMYVPAENVYYETIVKSEEGNELAEYCFARHVIPVSPNNFYVYLQTILIGLKGMQVEKNAQAIMSDIKRLGGDFGRFAEDFELVGKHLHNAQAKYDESGKRLDKLGNKIESLGSAVEEVEEKQPALLSS